VGIARLFKIHILAHNAIQSDLVEDIQERALFHLTAIRENPDFSDGNLLHEIVDTEREKLETALSEIGYAIHTLSRYEEKQGMLSGLFPSKIVLTKKELDETLRSFDYLPVVEECRRIDRDKAEMQSKIGKAEAQIDQVTPWLSLNVDVEELGETHSTAIIPGMCPAALYSDLCEELAKQSDLFDIRSVEERRDSVYFLLICHREIREKVRELFNRYEVEEPQFSELSGTFTRIRDRAEKEVERHRKTLESLDARITAFVPNRQKLQVLYDHYAERLQRKEALTHFGSTEHTFCIEGWVAEDDYDRLNEWLTRRFDEIHISRVEPHEDEHVPVKLKNSNAMKPFELITELFGMPGVKTVDPTPFLTPFFVLFFGICLTDAGYGLITLAFLAFALHRFKIQLKDNKLIWILLIGSVSTVIMGALTGGWWGNIVDEFSRNFPGVTMFERLRDAKNSITLLDPLSQSMTFFVITIALGIIQVIFGLSIRAVKAFMDREPGVAICENISWIFIIVGLISIQVLEGGRTAGTILALTGAGLILVGTNRTTRNPFVRLASGLYGLYGITGFLSDVLSYSRLLALGLTTGVIAMAVNLIGFIVIEIPVLGWILFVLIFVFGHAANLLISSLGAFVHTIRLQYVEFFPKFYTSGGHAFKPFSAERKYTIITEE
jgi:V/A-type H+-transporting ATPase subunit I